MMYDLFIHSFIDPFFSTCTAINAGVACDFEGWVNRMNELPFSTCIISIPV